MAGLFRYCSKISPFRELDKNPHPDYIHKMELSLADDLNSDDSATAGWAKKFIDGFEAEFRNYKPDEKTTRAISKYTDKLSVKVIGGNWCSDTRREVPRLCKVLYYSGMSADRYEYYRVTRDKKAVEDDFAAGRKVGLVPEIALFYDGTEVGKITESPKKSLEKDILEILKSKP